MSALVKCLLLVVAMFSFMQFVEMARVVREDGHPMEKELHDLQEISNNLFEKIKKNFDQETLNSIREAMAKTFEAGVATSKQKFEEFTAEVGQMSKTA